MVAALARLFRQSPEVLRFISARLRGLAVFLRDPAVSREIWKAAVDRRRFGRDRTLGVGWRLRVLEGDCGRVTRRIHGIYF
jgi:hypothetical protein